MALIDCITTFDKLLHTEYVFTIGRKQEERLISIRFDKKDFMHLLGLHYLKDIRQLHGDRGQLYDKIKTGKLPIAVLEKSDHFHKIKDARVALFPKLIEYIESDRIVFRYNSSQVINTRISHEYLLEFKDADDISYFFLQHDKRDDIYRGVTFFKKSNTDYTRGETIWTVLKIEKRQLENDCCEEIYRRPSYQEMFLDE